MIQLLDKKLADTDRVNICWDLGFEMFKYNPDSALMYAYKGLQLAQKIKYKYGEAKSYGSIATVLNRIGNYPKALHFYIEKLKIDEATNSIKGIASVKNNMGIVYTYMEDYKNALNAYKYADSVANLHAITELQYGVALNLGDVYQKMNKLDSAFTYYNKSLVYARNNNEIDRMGKSMLGIGNVYVNMQSYESALANYKASLNYLRSANDEDLICENVLGIAKMFVKVNNHDSVIDYCRQGLLLARQDNFISREIDICSFLSSYFSEKKMYDSAYVYLTRTNELKSFIQGKEALRNTEQITFNERLRQIELAEKLEKEKEERKQRLQHIFIGIFIPALFLFTIMLTRMRIKVSLVKFLGIISLLFLFEYLTLLLHPRVAHFTHHNPAYEILIFVFIASLLIPAHHKIEHWLIQLLVTRVQTNKQRVAKLEAEKLQKINDEKEELDNKPTEEEQQV